jgi:hypothetical protein
MKILTTFAAFLLSVLIATPVSAVTVGMGINANASASTTVGNVQISAAMQTRINNGKDHADQEIARRVTALTDLNTKVQAMTKLSAEEKTTFNSSINAQISTLTSLKAKIDSDSDIDTLKTDIKSITLSYRVYLLVIPQGHISVTADRLQEAADVASALSTKLSARIDADTASGKDTASAKTALTDMQTKITDANAQASASLSLVANLTPDEGDKTKQDANDKALKDARAKLKAGLADIVAARADARTIVKSLTGNASVTASTTVH